jgi:hypothetical protein
LDYGRHRVLPDEVRGWVSIILSGFEQPVDGGRVKLASAAIELRFSLVVAFG